MPDPLGDERDVVARTIDVESIAAQAWDITARLQALNSELFPEALASSAEGIVVLTEAEVTETAIGLLAALHIYTRCTEAALNPTQRAMAKAIADRIGLSPVVPEQA